MSAKKYDILIPGHYSCDIIFTGINEFPQLGKNLYSSDLTVVPGGVANSVIALQRLGVNIGWLGAMGNDFFSRFVLEKLEAENLDTSLLIRQDNQLRLVTVALSYPEDRAFVSYLDEAPDVIDMVSDHLGKVEFEHLHLGKLMVDERMPDLLRACHERGIFVSMDCQHHQETIQMPLVREILSLVDLFIPNEDEVKSLTGTEVLEAGAQALIEIVPYLVVKVGGKGAHAWRNGEHFYQPPIPGLKPIDTTGAGDVFNAGLLAAHVKDQDTLTCLRWATVAGGLATQGPGGTSTAPTINELQERLQELVRER